jgi:hypothetical protein
MNGHEVQRWDAEGFPPVLLDPALTGGQRGHVLVQLASTAGTSNEGNGLRNQSIGELDWNGKWCGSGARPAQRRMPTRRPWKASPRKCPAAAPSSTTTGAV